MFGNKKKKYVYVDNGVQKEIDSFHKHYSEKIKEYEERKLKKISFGIGDLVKTIYPNSPEMYISSVQDFDFSIVSGKCRNRTILEDETTITVIEEYFCRFHIVEPEICVKYHDSNFKLVHEKFKEEELIIVSRKDV